MIARSCHLDALEPSGGSVGHGSLGRHGDLGYGDGRVVVDGREYRNALSTHPPARVLYRLEGAERFECQAALTDDAAWSGAHADFTVFADGREVARARGVTAGRPQALSADVTGAHELELVVATSRWQLCQAVWLDARLDGVAPGESAPASAPATVRDTLGFAEMAVPPGLARAERCIATVASDGYEGMLDDLLGSLAANGNCGDALVAVFVLGPSEAVDRVIAKHRAVPVRCRLTSGPSTGCKSVLYSVSRVLRAERYLCLDVDLVVLGDLSPVFDAVDVCARDAVLACRDLNSRHWRDLDHIFVDAYGGRAGDLQRILGRPGGELAYPLVVNSGVYAGSANALDLLDRTLRTLPGGAAWLHERPDIVYRDQFLFNLALAVNRSGVELDDAYNLQLHSVAQGYAAEIEVRENGVRPDIRWEGRQVRILHESGAGRGTMPYLRGIYGSVPDPVPARRDGDRYAEFLAALHAWIGRLGLTAMQQSFYGSWDHDERRLEETATFPGLALLHHLVRASGAAAVVETGTFRGVSAACLASAVAHRAGARVVTIDGDEQPERALLWSALPDAMGEVIEARCEDHVAALRRALEAGERYDAALLDAGREPDLLAAEFELAAQLVCPGGTILVHDWRWTQAVQDALDRIQAAGYGVARLVGPSAVPGDSEIGIAVIQNRARE